MTRVKRYLVAVLACFIAFSCEKEEVAPEKGQVEFVFTASEDLSGGRIKSTASSLLISIERGNGEMVHQRISLTLQQFGSELLSEPISLQAGRYNLVEFIVLDENGNAIYAAPVKGSPLAYLVERRLPVGFNVGKDETTKVVPDVIKVEGSSAKQFGYATFDFNIVNTFKFSVGVMAYSGATKNFELTRAHMQVTADGETVYDAHLPAITNFIIVKEGFDNYTIKVSKHGYATYEQTFRANDLKEYGYGPPLVIVLLPSTLSQGLVAYYPFNGNADDATSNDLDGIVHGAMLTTDRNGKSDAAYIFDGVDDHIRVAHDDKLNLSSDFSISLWANIASNQEPHNGINDILRKWNGDAQGYPFSISYLNPEADDFQEDRVLIARYDGQGCSNNPLFTTPLIDNDVFVHIVMIKDADKIKTYLNGSLLGEVADPTTCSTSNDADMTIGARGNLVRYFKGKIDDIRIYNRALSQTEVGSLYGE